jgi:hypothetical protein
MKSFIPTVVATLFVAAPEQKQCRWQGKPERIAGFATPWGAVQPLQRRGQWGGITTPPSQDPEKPSLIHSQGDPRRGVSGGQRSMQRGPKGLQVMAEIVCRLFTVEDMQMYTTVNLIKLDS